LLGEATKENLFERWNCEEIGVDDLSYLKDTEDDKLLFVVLAPIEKIDVASSNDNKALANVNSKSPASSKTINGKNVSLYSTCIPRRFNKYLSLTPISSHLNKFFDLQNDVCSSIKQNTFQAPSFSVLHSFTQGFNIIFYSGTHKLMPSILHKDAGVRLVLSPGMTLLFHGYVIHSGGKSRSCADGNLLSDTRLFSYVWDVYMRTARENATRVYRDHVPLCSAFNGENKKCIGASRKCHSCECNSVPTVDLTEMDVSSLNIGDKILGNLELLGWLVVKGIDPNKNTTDKINEICEIGDWNRIGQDHCAYMKFQSNDISRNSITWNTDTNIVNYFNSIKVHILNRWLPSKNYITELRNILSNRTFSNSDQIPHCDFKVFKE